MSNGIRMPGLIMNENGIRMPGLIMNENGIQMPGLTVNENHQNVNINEHSGGWWTKLGIFTVLTGVCVAGARVVYRGFRYLTRSRSAPVAPSDPPPPYSKYEPSAPP